MDRGKGCVACGERPRHAPEPDGRRHHPGKDEQGIALLHQPEEGEVGRRGGKEKGKSAVLGGAPSGAGNGLSNYEAVAYREAASPSLHGPCFETAMG
jgi:hypothetical protein